MSTMSSSSPISLLNTSSLNSTTTSSSSSIKSTLDLDLDLDLDYERLPRSSSWYTHMFAGACAGMMEHACMYPFDAIKTRLQIIHPSPHAMYHGMTHAIARISSTEGLMTLWRGVSSLLVGAAPAHALYFATYEQCKYWVTDQGKKPITTLSAALAGTFSTIVQDAILNPFDVIKQRMQTWQSLQRTYPTNWACAQSIYHNEGWKAFYVSYPVTLSMSIPFQSIHFATYETVSSMLNPTHVYAPWVHMTAGGVAGALAASLTTPLDVIKTMLQTKGDALHPQLRQLKGWKQACVFLYQVHGWSGFWKGLGPRVLTHVPATALCWSTYEYFKFLVDWASPSSDGN